MDKDAILKIINSVIGTLDDAFQNSDHEEIVEDRVTEAISDLSFIKDKLEKELGV